MIVFTPWQAQNRVSFTCVLSGKTRAPRGCCKIFNIKVRFQTSCSIPTEQTLQFEQRELQHLVQHTLLTEHVAGGIVACLCDISIYPLFWILFELRWKDQEKVFTSRHTLTPVFFLLPHSNFRHAKWLDVVFYSLALPCALWDLTCFGKQREAPGFPQGCGCETSINQSYLTHRIFIDVTGSCQMLWIISHDTISNSPRNNRSFWLF